jgi:hypothetical protein
VAEQAAVRKCRTCKIHIPSFAKSETVYQKRGCCGEECALEFGKLAIQKKHEKVCKAQTKARKDKIKTKTEWLTEAQTAFNAYIRARDHGLGCISCGTTKQDIQYHAGHYRTRKAAPQLRFDETQVWLQCATCNNHLSGNLITYRRELLNRIGQAEVDRIECDNSEARFTIEDAKRIKAEYKAKLAELKPTNDL